MSFVLLRTLFKKAKDQQIRIPIEGLHCVTKPTLLTDLESHLMEWIAAMQRYGLPVAGIEIMKCATLICYLLRKRMRADPSTQLMPG